MKPELRALVLQAGRLLGNGSDTLLLELVQHYPEVEVWERATRKYQQRPATKNPRAYYRVLMADSQAEIDRLEAALPVVSAGVSPYAASPYARYYANADQLGFAGDGGE